MCRSVKSPDGPEDTAAPYLPDVHAPVGTVTTVMDSVAVPVIPVVAHVSVTLVLWDAATVSGMPLMTPVNASMVSPEGSVELA